MLTVLLWKWNESNVRRGYAAEHVNVMARMIRRNYTGEIRIVCITDDPEGITDAETYPLWTDASGPLPGMRGKIYPTCYRRLKIFSGEPWPFGKRFVSVDLDAVIVGNLNELWDRPEPFVGWRVTRGMKPRVYNGSMFLFDADAFPEIWSEFIADPRAAITNLHSLGYMGSDQSWMAYKLGSKRPHWTAKEGVLSFRLDRMHFQKLPAHARVVFFHGDLKPWSKRIFQHHAWVREHWR